MKYALVNGERHEAAPGLKGQCPGCEDEVLSRCGEIKVWHWSHRGRRMCDPWWENETEWHRAWKGHFVPEWQEYFHRAENGEKHVADVKTDVEWVLEFQHSAIKSDERISRNEFYPKLMWIVDGARRQRDRSQFFDAIHEAGSFTSTFANRFFKVFSREPALLREWAGSPWPVFFDFGNEATIWLLLPHQPGEDAYVVEFLREGFIRMHRGDGTKKDYFSELLNNLKAGISSLAKVEREQPGLQLQHALARQYQNYRQNRAFPSRPRRRF